MLQLPETTTAEIPAIIAKPPRSSDLPSDIPSLIALHTKASAAASAASNDSELDAAGAIALTIYSALLAANGRNVREEVWRLCYVADYCKALGIEGELDGYFDLPDLSLVAKNLDKLTLAPRPSKSTLPFNRGRKLTRSGLLYRYHAFLISELHTVSMELYGNRDYASYFWPEDHAVNSKIGGRGKHPFNSPRTLAGRAKKVLKSQKIDAENADPRDCE